MPAQPGVKRQVVFRVRPEDWDLLQAAAAEHGSIQAAVIAGIRALRQSPGRVVEPPIVVPNEPRAGAEPEAPDRAEEQSAFEASDEITAREAAELLGVKADTVRGYIRSGRLPGRYVGEPDWRGWLTSQVAVTNYAARRAELSANDR